VRVREVLQRRLRRRVDAAIAELDQDEEPAVVTG